MSSDNWRRRKTIGERNGCVDSKGSGDAKKKGCLSRDLRKRLGAKERELMVRE